MPSNTTFPKFEVDIKDLWTTREEEALVARFEGWYTELQKRSATREAAAMSKSFRLMGLPPELRNRIYAFAFQNEKKFGKRRSLALVATPNITRVSKKVREETLPLFFATTSFRLSLASDFYNRYRPDAEYKSKREIQRSGTLHIKQEVKKTLGFAGNKILIGNIDFVVCNAADWRSYDRDWGMQSDIAVFSARVRLDQGNVVVGMSYGEAANNRPELSDAIDEVMDDMKAVIEKFSGRKNFQGFSMRDLEQIVKTLRHQQKS
ncbi:hypothetical protein AC578_683 [Pseudocercospora eumusae]|uniref:Uncharacterized protein n=1 Tax=Pseudocercospora eumusae TaxID=321146 RepID=A0A139HKT3_9PEZI|nr:hypothetical protein AC578_683 [Pseudocercospora eumusae]